MPPAGGRKSLRRSPGARRSCAAITLFHPPVTFPSSRRDNQPRTINAMWPRRILHRRNTCEFHVTSVQRIVHGRRVRGYVTAATRRLAWSVPLCLLFSVCSIPVVAIAQVTPAAGYTPPDDTPSIRVGVTLYADYTYHDEPEDHRRRRQHHQPERVQRHAAATSTSPATSRTSSRSASRRTSRARAACSRSAPAAASRTTAWSSASSTRSRSSTSTTG